MKKIHSKLKAVEWSQHFSHYQSMENSQALNGRERQSGQISNQSENLWVFMLPARMKKIQSKVKAMEWSQHFSHYMSIGNFQNTQVQLTHKSLVGSCRISNPFNILWLFSLPARIKKNQSKMKELEWSQDFPPYNPMGAICRHGNQSFDPILPKT